MLSVTKLAAFFDGAKGDCPRVAMDKLGERVLTDMAMHEPHAWVIGLEGNGQVPFQREKCDVPSWGVVEFEIVDAGGDIVRGCALSQDDKVMSVQMHGMGVESVGLAGEVGEALFGDDEVNVTLVVIFRDDGVIRTECGVLEVQDRRV